jgi:opacity protein-like surface antigen
MTSNLDKPIAIATGILLAIIALCSIIMFNTSSAKADTGCFVGGSAGANASYSRLNDGNTTIDLGTSSPMISAEIGCKMSIQKVFVGAILRGDYANAKTRIDTQSLKSNGRWMALGTLGTAINDGTSAYVVAGIAGTKYDVSNIATEAVNYWVAGVGISTKFFDTGLSLFAEVDALFGRQETFANVKLKDAQIVPRVGLRYHW